MRWAYGRVGKLRRSADGRCSVHELAFSCNRRVVLFGDVRNTAGRKGHLSHDREGHGLASPDSNTRRHLPVHDGPCPGERTHGHSI